MPRVPMHRIETAEDYRKLRDRGVFEPVFIGSREQGPIAVPCGNTLLVRPALIAANAYNPNYVSADKMNLLARSIIDNGFCFPVVSIWDDAQACFVVIDGFHRTLIASAEWLGLDYVPLVVLAHDITQRMAATVQFNKARGVHQVDLDAEVIRALIEQGLDEPEIAARLGIDLEAVHRYKQVTGVAELFRNADWSMSWEMREEDDPQ